MDLSAFPRARLCRLPTPLEPLEGLTGLVREGFFDGQETVIFLHTGGLAALFAYGDLLVDI